MRGVLIREPRLLLTVMFSLGSWTWTVDSHPLEVSIKEGDIDEGLRARRTCFDHDWVSIIQLRFRLEVAS